MSSRVINTSLLFLGIGLIAAIVVVRRQREPVSNVPSGKTDVILRRVVHPGHPVAPSLHEPLLPEGFTWDSIESRDYKQYIANLRAIECPEQTIRDIIVADINKLYEPREAPLRIENFFPAGISPDKGDPADLQRMRQLREVQLEKRALLKELLRIVVPLDTIRTAGSRRYRDFEAAFNALPEHKRAEVQMIQENYWYYSDYFSTQYPNRRDPKYVAEYTRINDERRHELSKVLTPAEIEDFELRTSHAAAYMRERLRDFTASEQEFREIFRIKADYDVSFGGKFISHPGTIEESHPETRPEIEQRVRQVLGEERYRDYQRAHDPNYRALSQIAARYDLPPDTANAAYAIDQAYRDQLRRFPSDPQQLAAAKTQAEQALTQLLGERGTKAFNRMRK